MSAWTDGVPLVTGGGTGGRRGAGSSPGLCGLSLHPVAAALPQALHPAPCLQGLPFEGLLLPSLRCLQSAYSRASGHIPVLLWDRDAQRATRELLLSSVGPHAFPTLTQLRTAQGGTPSTCLCCLGRSSPFPPACIRLSGFLSPRSNNNNDKNNYNTLAF